MKKICKKIYFQFKWREKCRISSKTSVDKNSTFEGRNYLSYGTEVINAHFGYASGTGMHCFLKDVVIGRYCCLAKDIRTIIGLHPSKKFVSTHPAFYSVTQQWGFSYVKQNKFKINKRLDEKKEISIMIGNDVWIGEGVRLLEGITIGDGAIIAAGAIVTKDVPPYAVVGGVPAKVIRYRFEKEDIEFLETLKWWEKDEKWLREYAEYFEDIKKLRNILEKR